MQQKAKHIIIFAKYSSIQFPLKIIYSSFELQLIYLKIIDLNISNVDYWKFEFEFQFSAVCLYSFLFARFRESLLETKSMYIHNNQSKYEVKCKG